MPRDRGSHGTVWLCLDALLLAQRGSRRAQLEALHASRTCSKTF